MAIKSIASVKSHFQTGDRPTQGEFEDLIDTLARTTPIAIASAAEGGKTGIYEILGDGDVTARSAGTFGLQVLSIASTASAYTVLGITSAASEALIQATIGSALSSWGANSITATLVEASTTASAHDALGITAVGQAIITAVTTASATEALHVLRSGTAQATTSGTAFDFTGIPSWVRKITVIWSGVSLDSTDSILLQLGASGGIETSGYLSSRANLTTVVSVSNSTAGFILSGVGASDVASGVLILALIDASTNTWAGSFSSKSSTSAAHTGAGNKSLSGTLDRVRFTTAAGNNFDAGSVNILYE